MANGEWIKEFPGSIIVADVEGKILEMNEKACKVFEKQGGKDLIGKNLVEVHFGSTRTKLEQMLSTKTANTYSIEKNGVKKLIYQTPWFKDEKYAGFIELSLEIPLDMPHYVRKG